MSRRRTVDFDGESFDVIVVGFGGAGACAAIEAAAEGARVLVVDRFEGGGATAMSGGVVYAGAGTPAQRAAGFADDVDAMVAYLRAELEDGVDEVTLRAFCERSASNLEWLGDQGVGFSGRFFPDKTTQPPQGYGLYYSGNEKQRASVALPVPRGHVADGGGMTGHVIYAALRASAERCGVVVRRHCRVDGLVRDSTGRVIGVDLLDLSGSHARRSVHAALGAAVTALSTARAVGRSSARRALSAWERTVGLRRRLLARGGVVLAAGGFVFDPGMLAHYAPAYAESMPLGTAGDDGEGIRLGLSVGASAREMERCAASRFIAPPEAFVRGVLVSGGGERICDESLYGATLSRFIAERAGGEAWLVIDHASWERARDELRREERVRDQPLASILAGEENHLIFRNLTASANLHLNRVRAGSLEALARACHIPEAALLATVRAYNAAAEAGEGDPMGKDPSLCAPLARGPFYAIDCALGSRLFPGPCLTLGGLRVDGLTGEVLDGGGKAIPGLYAAGRNAAGVCARSYVSGLSLADCVFSGRNAGREAARAAFAGG